MNSTIPMFVRFSDERGAPYFKTDPVVIAEVLSPSTQRYGRGDKRQVYPGLDSLREYVLISQTETSTIQLDLTGR